MNASQLIRSFSRIRELACPGPDTYAVSPLNDAEMGGELSNILRVFSPIDPAKGRKPPIPYGLSFDMDTDTLSDSPVTVAAKLGASWEECNQHAIVQIGVCNFRCWYCYVDYRFLSGREVVKVSPGDILDEFLRYRARFRSSGRDLNVLRISGGEPFFAPDLISSCLDLVREVGLEHEICVKTETNLSPLGRVEEHSFAEMWTDLEELAQFDNFLIHPTLHGISAESLARNSSVGTYMFRLVCDGLQSLLDYQLDFFPSFGSNTVPLEDVQPFFEMVRTMNENLPLRFAVRPFKWDYPAVSRRSVPDRTVRASSHHDVIRAWDALLQETYGVGYGEIPRHRIPLYA